MYTCTMTADDWDLYCGIDGTEEVAAILSKALTEEVNKVFDLGKNVKLDHYYYAEQIRDKMYELMEKYAEFGAGDTEPECALVEELEKVFKLKRTLTR